jgi:DNA-binding HxlR family transcriptional regulator
LTTSSKRTYDQYCALAVALDVIGERWTLLVVRELLIRPRRYAELLQALPGIGTNLLAERLRFLAESKIIRMVHPGDRRSGYELMERGEALREPVMALARWGMDTMADHARYGHVNSGWSVLGVQSLIDDSRASATPEDYVFHVDDEVFTISVRDGHAKVVPDAVPNAAMTVITDAATLSDIGSRKLDPIAALLADRLAVTGDPEAMPRCLRLLGLYDQRGSGEVHDVVMA